MPDEKGIVSNSKDSKMTAIVYNKGSPGTVPVEELCNSEPQFTHLQTGVLVIGACKAQGLTQNMCFLLMFDTNKEIMFIRVPLSSP